ncbi:MAG: transketolase family protein, partial [bacterium]|nr:transketolase family protein [bacterium]
MIPRTANLTRNLFAKDIEQIPIRNGYGIGIVEAAKKNPNIVLLCADLTDSTRSREFQKEFPDRFVQVGVQ